MVNALQTPCHDKMSKHFDFVMPFFGVNVKFFVNSFLLFD